MRPPRFPLAMPWHGPALLGLCALYLLAGLTGHDPWKNDDAVHFGVVLDLLKGGNWLVPRIAGEPMLDTPPLYYWVAVLCGKLFGWLLPLHDAARLASGIFGALFLACLAWAGRTLHNPARVRAGTASVLIAIGSLGLLVPLHDTQPLTALLAASAAFYAGCAILPHRPLYGGMMAGLALGLGFFSGGLLALVTLIPVLLLLPAIPQWRTPDSLRGLGSAVLVATLLCAAWPLLLHEFEPNALALWWSKDAANIHYQSEWPRTLASLAELLAWFAWPAWPLAIWAVWLNRRRLAQPDIALPLLGTSTSLLTLLFFNQPRPLPALPLLVPLILLAAGNALYLRRGAANAFDWFAMMTLTIVAGLIWLGGIAMTAGIPAQIAHNFAKLEPGFTAGFSPAAYAAAALVSLAWLWLIFGSPRSPWRAMTHWAAGMVMIWTLLMALWLPWIDYGKTYRGVAESIRQSLPENPGCIAGRSLGSVQRISLEYFAGIVTLRAGTPAANACTLLIEQSSKAKEAVPAGWQKIWEGHRPGDRSERIRLYRREPQ